MGNLVIAFSTVFPLLTFMVIGYLVKLARLIDEGSLRKANGLVFRIFLPCMVFKTIYNVDFSRDLDGNLLLFIALSCAVSGVLSYVLVCRAEKDNKKRGAYIQGLIRTNFIVFGIPIATALYGGGNVGHTAVLVAVTSPYFNIVITFILEYLRSKDLNGEEKPSLGKILLGTLKAPCTIAILLGFVFLLLHLRLPPMVYDVVDDLAGVTTPLALILLGASFDFKDLKYYKKPLSVFCLLRLIVLPLIFITLGVLCGFRNQQLIGIVALFGCPVSINAYTNAIQFDSDAVLTGQMVVVTALLSTVTLFLWVFILMNLGYL